MKPKFPILKNFKIFGIISILLCATGLVALIALPFGQNFFNLSIDFAGGTEMEFNLHKTVDQTVQTEVRELFQEVTGVDPSSVTSSGDSNENVLIRSTSIDSEKRAAVIDKMVETYSLDKDGKDLYNNNDVSPSVGSDLQRAAFLCAVVAIVLMLIYNGCRISEFLDLKKENVHLEEQYFDVIASKTENGLRKVPIADKVLPFYKAWYEGSQCEYLLHTPDQKHFDYRNYYDSYFTPLMEQLGYDQTPHCTRHTCISMLTEAHVDQTMIKKIVGHSGAMTLTERVYTHLDIETLVEAINKI